MQRICDTQLMYCVVAVNWQNIVSFDFHVDRISITYSGMTIMGHVSVDIKIAEVIKRSPEVM